MLVTLVCEKSIYRRHLPEICAGKYWIEDHEKDIEHNRLLGIEADETNNRWMIKSEKKVRLFKDEVEVDIIYLEEGNLYPVLLGKENAEKAFLLAEPFSSDRITYQKYALNHDAIISIGQAAENQIQIKNKYVSARHAQLIYSGNTWMIRDNQSTNGIYVNSKRVENERSLSAGDTVFILGFKMVIGSNYLAMNHPEDSIHIADDLFDQFTVSEEAVDETFEPEDQEFFYRSPRFKRQIEPLCLKVDVPTQKDRGDETPIMLAMAPALLMAVATFSSDLVAITNTMENDGNLLAVIPTMLKSVSMLGSMVLFPFLMKRRDKKQKAKKEVERREKYLKYLQNIKEEIEKNKHYQVQILCDNNPEITRLTQDEAFWNRSLWGKKTDEDDFLVCRIGIGNVPLQAELKFPEDRFSVEEDDLREELIKFQREEQLLQNVPVCLSLKEEKVIGIAGDTTGVFNMLHNILLQIITLHSYDEVKIVCIGEKRDMRCLDYLKWAQHSWDNEGKRRYIAVTEENIRELSMVMSKIIQKRQESMESLPHYIIVSTSKILAQKCSFLPLILESKELSGFSIINAYDTLKSLPKECTTVIQVNARQAIMYRMRSREQTAIVQDGIKPDYVRDVVSRVAEYRLDLQQGKYKLPEIYTFLDMFGVGKYEHLNIQQRWKENDPVMTLQTPIGVDADGETFYLDLHEKFHGPHGLVAGMTGSGKSEIIITLILSLAVNYHPNEVAFVLIDHEGGELTGAFDNENYRLPHLVGTITNLDESAITRSILSIKSELRRRQLIFNQTRVIANEGTMDIYKYQKMFRNGQVTEPLPHLLIIADEFAELKSQQPEFMEQLISTARIGRSLGVHLILATQKPGGLVDEPIWANSRFKICFKVQDKADSMDMLKRPDAAEITETGRFYLQVGNNEVFKMGQSAWCGAPYVECDTKISENNSDIEVYDALGNVVDKLKAVQPANVKVNGKQIVRIMEYIGSIAKKENIRIRQVWLPEIPAMITLDGTIEKYNYQCKKGCLSAVVGEYDDPYMQKQEPLELNFVEDGNVIIYGSAGSGKELFLNTLLYSLYRNYDAEELNTYILDFGAEAMRMFEGAPQTGGVILDDEADRVESLFSMIQKEIRSRKKLFADYGGDYTKYANASDTGIPYMLVIINNYSYFAESYEKYDEAIMSMTRECPKYGIYFLLTAASANSIRYRITQNFNRVYVMQLNDETEYMSIFGNTNGVFPSKIYGRGIMKNDEFYVYQIAHIAENETDVMQTVKSFCRELYERSGGRTAPQIPSMPDNYRGGEDE